MNKKRLGRCSRHFYEALATLDEEKINDILDVGCGDGRTFSLLDRFKKARRVGLDIDLKSLAKAKEKCFAVLGGGEKLPFPDGTFDLIVEFHAFHHIGDYARAVSEAQRCLRAGGYLLMVEAVNDNPVFSFIRDKHPIAKHMPIESNFRFKDLVETLEKGGFAVKSRRRFGMFFEFTLGGIPGMPDFVKRATSSMDAGLERMFGTKYCASCVVLAKKE